MGGAPGGGPRSALGCMVMASSDGRPRSWVFIFGAVLTGSEGSEPAPVALGDRRMLKALVLRRDDVGGGGGGAGEAGAGYAWVPANPVCKGGLSVSSMGMAICRKLGAVI